MITGKIEYIFRCDRPATPVFTLCIRGQGGEAAVYGAPHAGNGINAVLSPCLTVTAHFKENAFLA